MFLAAADALLFGRSQQCSASSSSGSHTSRARRCHGDRWPARETKGSPSVPTGCNHLQHLPMPIERPTSKQPFEWTSRCLWPSRDAHDEAGGEQLPARFVISVRRALRCPLVRPAGKPYRTPLQTGLNGVHRVDPSGPISREVIGAENRSADCLDLRLGTGVRDGSGCIGSTEQQTSGPCRTDDRGDPKKLLHGRDSTLLRLHRDHRGLTRPATRLTQSITVTVSNLPDWKAFTSKGNRILLTITVRDRLRPCRPPGPHRPLGAPEWPESFSGYPGGQGSQPLLPPPLRAGRPPRAAT
ncbi:hypothetical protein EDD40_3383 [Saccharothrix texasensis]|uniref:Uncharacterized protein n=1 Tax=Saccharothrix texasensis TaxID=103734 RepID=A0A3N1H683_9PSEU|nr:hypothetical protein EDD40_3383 [Saccharothrix texasensis]